MRCHRCQDPVVLFVAGEVPYCRPCKADIAKREQDDARRMAARSRFRVVKDTSGWYPGGAA